MAGLGPLAVTGAASAQAATMSATHAAARPWDKPIEIPGLGALNTGHDAAGNSISCVTRGYCAATGNYNGPDGEKAFVVNETKGHWGKAIELPGLGALIKSGILSESSVACGLPGDCAVGGDYIGGRDHTFAFVASEVNGKWGKAIKVPGLAALNTGNDEELPTLSCSPGGNNCTAGGTVLTSSNGTRNIKPWVVSERNGHWSNALLVPGLGQGPTQDANIRTLDCSSAGNCSAGGNGPGNGAFVVTEKNGKWGKLMDVPGLDALNQGGGGAETEKMSCPSDGNCGAGGIYFDSEDTVHVFAVSEKNGTWGNAIEIPGTSALDTNGFIDLHAISCTAPGDCDASGTYKDTEPAFQGWVATEKNGNWGNAIEIPGLAALNKFRNVGIARVTCATPGNCVAFGNEQVGPGDDNPKFNAFIASQTKGVWAKATPFPGLNKLAFRDSSVHSVSCPSTGHCSAAGFYEDKQRFAQAFVADQK